MVVIRSWETIAIYAKCKIVNGTNDNNTHMMLKLAFRNLYVDPIKNLVAIILFIAFSMLFSHSSVCLRFYNYAKALQHGNLSM